MMGERLYIMRTPLTEVWADDPITLDEWRACVAVGSDLSMHDDVLATWSDPDHPGEVVSFLHRNGCVQTWKIHSDRVYLEAILRKMLAMAVALDARLIADTGADLSRAGVLEVHTERGRLLSPWEVERR